MRISKSKEEAVVAVEPLAVAAAPVMMAVSLAALVVEPEEQALAVKPSSESMAPTEASMRVMGAAPAVAAVVTAVAAVASVAVASVATVAPVASVAVEVEVEPGQESRLPLLLTISKCWVATAVPVATAVISPADVAAAEVVLS
jgi:hypothetical protein